MTADFRPCPFCGSSDPTHATATDDDIATVAVVCLECGATGPKAMSSDPPDHIEHPWNQRQGVDDRGQRFPYAIALKTPRPPDPITPFPIGPGTSRRATLLDDATGELGIAILHCQDQVPARNPLVRGMVWCAQDTWNQSENEHYQSSRP